MKHYLPPRLLEKGDGEIPDCMFKVCERERQTAQNDKDRERQREKEKDRERKELVKR